MKEELKRLLLRHAHKKLDRAVRLSSGAESSEYFDAKQITLFPERAVVFARVILESLDLRGIDAVGGMSLGADPVVSALTLVAYLEKGLNLPGFLVRREPKKHGLQKMAEGVELKKGMRVLIVDDVITQGSATLAAIQAVEDAGAEVAQVCCLVDREEGGSRMLAQKYKFYAVFKKSEL